MSLKTIFLSQRISNQRNSFKAILRQLSNMRQFIKKFYLFNTVGSIINVTIFKYTTLGREPVSNIYSTRTGSSNELRIYARTGKLGFSLPRKWQNHPSPQ